MALLSRGCFFSNRNVMEEPFSMNSSFSRKVQIKSVRRDTATVSRRYDLLWGSPKLTHLCSDKRTLSLTACRVAAVMVADAAVPRC
jgi:hypothetical protein